MLQFSRWQTFSIFGLIALAALFAVPNFFSDEELAAMPGIVPKSQINLGLDLQGGSYLLAEVDTGKVLKDRLAATRSEVQRVLRPDRNAGKERVRVIGGRVAYNEETGLISFRLEDVAQGEDALKRVRDLTQGNVLSGVRPYVARLEENRITVEMTPEARKKFATDAVTASLNVIRRRIDPAGNKEVSIQPQGENRIVVQVPGDNDPERLKEVIGEEGQLTFHRHDPTVNIQDAAAGALPPRRILRNLPQGEGGGGLVLHEDPIITGDMVNEASAGLNPDGGGFQINFQFDNRGAKRFARYTAENIGQIFAIVLDGEIISAPRIQGAIPGGSGRITGDFSPEEASRIATLIQAGALPAPIQIVEQRSVGPDLGADSVRAGSLALIIGFIAVVVYMIASYGRFGIYANVALVANVILIAGALSLFGSTLTLPGIAGIVLTIGMAVDANVLIFERIREELTAGKTPINAIEQGFTRARSAILDANVTTFAAAFIMFFLGAGPVRGFAITLMIGVATSVFTAYFLTRLLAGGWVLRKRPQSILL